MRGGKSRLYEGGHRVPCFVRWPDGNIGGLDGGKDLSGLTQVQDLCPTILGLTNSPPINDTVVDGIDLSRALRGVETVPDRTLIVQYGLPEAFRMTCVMQVPGDFCRTSKEQPKVVLSFTVSIKIRCRRAT